MKLEQVILEVGSTTELWVGVDGAYVRVRRLARNLDELEAFGRVIDMLEVGKEPRVLVEPLLKARGKVHVVCNACAAAHAEKDGLCWMCQRWSGNDDDGAQAAGVGTL